MDDRNDAQVGLIDDDFERLGRLAGAELRQPPPAGGPGAVLRTAHRRRASVAVAAAGVTVAVLVTGLVVANSRSQDDSAPIATVPPNTVPTVVTTEAFAGSWLSIDIDGSSQTMEIVSSLNDEYQFVARDNSATACSGAPATMTGTGLLETDDRLVIAQAELTCDDGTIPGIGLPPQADLANFTLELDPATDEFVDSFGVVWRRVGSNGEPIEPSTVTVPSSAPAASGGMWPQSTLEEVHAAQEAADAGDPDYTWQIGAQLTEDDQWANNGELELVDRFLEEVLGWEAYLYNSRDYGDGDGWKGGDLSDQRYLRCAPGMTNPLYPPNPDAMPGSFLARGASCAPTIDDLHYETVRLDLAQLDRQGLDGIWVVSQWTMTPPSAQADPAVVEAQARERLQAFLGARVAGEDAEGYVEVEPDVDVPLLYATTGGVPYERYEIELVEGPQWPDGNMTFSVRLFADGDATMVEQDIDWQPSEGMLMDANATKENGQPITMPYTSADGEVTVSAPSTWDTWLPGTFELDSWDVWLGRLWRYEDGSETDRIEFVDPLAYDTWCADNGGSPLLTAPANAAAIAQQVIDDPNFDTTAPVTALIGGIEAVSIDVTLAPGGKACGIGMVDIPRWIHTIGWDLEHELRLRLYLVDLPAGMSVQTLAITVVAPEDRFDDVIAETAPIIDSIEFHP